jgi:general secretion pathway protein G
VCATIADVQSSSRQRSTRQRGLTLVELAIAIGIVGVLLSLAVPAWTGYRERMKRDQAIQDISVMGSAIERYWQDARAYPDNLAQAGLGTATDPWGNPYRYLNLDAHGARGHARKDHSLVPINTDFDLYSMGPDGRSAPPLTAQMSRDDIVRANNGKFIGPAANY